MTEHNAASLPRRIYLHIGLPRTGTTWLQEIVFPHLRGVTYVNIAPQHNLGQLGPLLHDLVDLCNNPTDERVGDRLPDARCRVLDRLPSESLLLSNENHFNGMPATPSDLDLPRILRNLKSLCPDVRIILVLRRQSEILPSLYAQRIYFGGETITFEQYLEIYGEKLVPYLTYVALVETLFDIIGRDRVYIDFFERFRRNNSRFVKRMLNWVGATAGWTPSRSRRFTNPSMSRRELDTTLEMNCRARDEGWQQEDRMRRVHELRQRRIPLFLHPWLLRRPEIPRRRALLAEYRDSNQRLSRLIGFDVEALRYP